LQYPSFAVLKESLVFIIGGIDYARTAEEACPQLKSGHVTMIIDVPIYQKQYKHLRGEVDDNKLNLTINFGPVTLQPRSRSACVSDGRRFIYMLGSQYPKAMKSVEQYDH
jgi:hypothetical protein